MSVRSAEMTEYAANCMLATKISFINEIANICERVGADVSAVRRGIGAYHRIGYHLIYPGVGYGGSCFPKDAQALVDTARQSGYDPQLIAAVDAVNHRQKTVLAEKIEAFFSGQGGLSGKVLARGGWRSRPTPAIRRTKNHKKKKKKKRSSTSESKPTAKISAAKFGAIGFMAVALGCAALAAFLIGDMMTSKYTGTRWCRWSSPRPNCALVLPSPPMTSRSRSGPRPRSRPAPTRPSKPGSRPTRAPPRWSASWPASRSSRRGSPTPRRGPASPP